MAPCIVIDPKLVEYYIMELARYGAFGETGVCRTVYSPEWMAAQDQYAAWCADVNLCVKRDAVGTVWGRLEGSEGGKAIVSGSHIDSQQWGGRYDGALGVIAALVAIRTLQETFGTPRHPLEAVSFCEEEGSRFQAANFWGSRAVTGGIRLDELHELRDYGGETIGDAMRAAGLEPARLPEASRNDIDTFIELHIEQGPVLEKAGVPVGLVNAITGLRRYTVEIVGRSDHAGACPMHLRRDPMPAAADIISGVIQTAVKIGAPGVTTVGRMLVEPNFPAIIPEKVTLTVDARHPDSVILDRLCSLHEQLFSSVATHRNLEVIWRVTFDLPPCLSDTDTTRLLQEVALEQNVPTIVMHSGAVHDTQVMASMSKTAMIFVASQGGRSHTPAEFTSLEHAVAGITVLTAALFKLAY